ncbi:MAG TPA: helix-turn-helix domain-containing protein [Propionibacteriaceae bacterium]
MDDSGCRRVLECSVQTICDWRTRGYGPPGFRLGKHLRFRESDVFAWLDRMTRPVAQRCRAVG